MKRFLCSLLLFVLNVLCVGSSFGYDDCSLVNTEYAGQGFKLVDLRKDNTDETLKNSTVTPDDVITMHNTVIDTASLTTALLNQRKKCCEVNTTMNPIRCKNDAQYFNLNVPDSTFLFDHLLDVMLRRLDGENLYDGTIPDGSGAERRKLMDEIGGNITGTIPDAIKKPYETFRTVKADHLFQGGFSQVTTEDRAYYLATMRTGKNANIIRNYP
ncbi:MAG: hypothetical protein LBP53_08460 [Candidatus Peribacteria bacterium]|jgi:hypothetical protein|nr:hypothetical protein [Candidatus Peribacteria bacterium]